LEFHNKFANDDLDLIGYYLLMNMKIEFKELKI